MSAGHHPDNPAPGPRADRTPARPRPDTPSTPDFETLFRDAHPRLWIIARAVSRSRADADDIVQEAAMIALAKWRSGHFTPGTNFPAWMARIVRFVALNHARRESRALPTGDRAPDLAAPPHAPAASALTLDTSARLPPDQPHFDDRTLAALHALESDARACLLLRVVGGMPYCEISALLDVPEGTAMSHVFRARAALARVLAPSPTPRPPTPPGTEGPRV